MVNFPIRIAHGHATQFPSIISCFGYLKHLPQNRHHNETCNHVIHSHYHNLPVLFFDYNFNFVLDIIDILGKCYFCNLWHTS